MKTLMTIILGVFTVLLNADNISIGYTDGEIPFTVDSELGVIVSCQIKNINSNYKYIKITIGEKVFNNWENLSKDKYQSFSYTSGESFTAGNIDYEILTAHKLVEEVETDFFVWRGTDNDLPQFITDLGETLEIYAEVKDKINLGRYLNKAYALEDLIDDRINWDRNEIISLNSQLNGLDGEIETLQDTIDALEADNTLREQQVSDRNDVIDVKEQEIHNLEVEKQGLDPVADVERIEEIDERITVLKGEINDFVKKNEADNIQIFENDQTIAEAEGQIEEYEGLKTSIPEEITYLENEITYLEQNQVNLSEIIEEYENSSGGSGGNGGNPTNTVYIIEKSDSDSIDWAAAVLLSVPLAGIAGGAVYEEAKPYIINEKKSDSLPSSGVNYDYPVINK